MKALAANFLSFTVHRPSVEVRVYWGEDGGQQGAEQEVAAETLCVFRDWVKIFRG